MNINEILKNTPLFVGMTESDLDIFANAEDVFQV